jgi:hypothetical protein
MLYGSLQHDQYGRKRKTIAWKKTPRPAATAFEPLRPSDNYIRETKTYASAPRARNVEVLAPVGDGAWRVAESRNFTVAPAYNKGAYQVISKGDVKHIGK